MHELLRKRDAGHVRIGAVSTHPNEELSVPLARLGVRYEGERLRELKPAEARQLLANLFAQSLAYSVQLMGYSEAEGFAAYVLDELFPPGARLWTNIDDFNLEPDKFRDGYGAYFVGTESTFSVGVFARTESTLAVVWIEEED